MVLAHLILLPIFVCCRKYEIPPLDAYQISPNLYSQDKDQNRTIVDSSLIDDIMEWDKHEIEFLAFPKSASNTNGKELTIQYPGFNYICEITEKEISNNLFRRQLSFDAEVKKWTNALLPLSKRILTYKAGWWSYEYSHNKHIRQYHHYKDENSSKKSDVVEEYLLGRYSPELSKEYLDSTGTKLVREYPDGDMCVLENGVARKSRFTQVIFKCDPTSLIDSIESVIELGTCSYIMTILTPRICNYSRHPAKKTLIKCYPKDEQSLIEFHPSLSDPEASVIPTDTERNAHKKRQHSLFKSVASNSNFPMFSKLVNELMVDLLEEIEPKKEESDDSEDNFQADVYIEI